MTRPRILTAFLALLALSPAPAAAQRRITGPNLLAWMGLEAGDTMAFETSDGGRMCVTVGAPRRIADRNFVPLLGLVWPGMASDSRILVPLDGTLDFLVDRTPGPRPAADSFLPPGGWSAMDWIMADTLVYRWCEACMDAGTTIVLAKGGGIRSIVEQSIAGPTSLTRVEGGCAEREGVEPERVQPEQRYDEPARVRERRP
ncbi:MAG TPA: hypothetical protein VIE68_08515 [Gemmatimonadota bacterium]|jgi:hypothetical protein